MTCINPNCGFLSNMEVYDLLRRDREELEKNKMETKRAGYSPDTYQSRWIRSKVWCHRDVQSLHSNTARCRSSAI